MKGIAKKGIQEVAKQSGTISNPVARFAVGATALLGVNKLSRRGTNDNTDKANTKRITQPNLDTVNFLSPDEAFKLVSNDSAVRNRVASSIYYKDIGSRKNLTVAQNDTEYSNANDTTKSVYNNKAITNIRKLVTEGYVKIERQTLDVNISNEKVNL